MLLSNSCANVKCRFANQSHCHYTIETTLGKLKKAFTVCHFQTMQTMAPERWHASIVQETKVGIRGASRVEASHIIFFYSFAERNPLRNKLVLIMYRTIDRRAYCKMEDAH